MLKQPADQLQRRTDTEPQEPSPGRPPNEHPGTDSAAEIADEDKAMSPDAQARHPRILPA